MYIENGVNRKVIAVSVLKTPASKASFRTALVPAFCFNETGRTVNPGRKVIQSLVMQQVLVEQDLVKEYPLVLETRGSRTGIILVESVKETV